MKSAERTPVSVLLLLLNESYVCRSQHAIISMIMLTRTSIYISIATVKRMIYRELQLALRMLEFIDPPSLQTKTYCK